MKRLRDPGILEWLDSRTSSGDEVAGYNATGWEASTWILHAMYETDEVPGGLSHDDVHQIERAAGTSALDTIAGEPLKEVLADAVAVGGVLGRSERPGAGWQRLRWRELAQRLDVDPFAIDVPPCSRSFPYKSWPANIEPPGEGSLDREQFSCLLDHLAAATPQGPSAPCCAFYGMVAVHEFDDPVIYVGELRELADLYDDERVPGSPSNIWADDKSWFVYTDWDLWSTKVSGSFELIDRLAQDDELETVTLPF